MTLYDSVDNTVVQVNDDPDLLEVVAAVLARQDDRIRVEPFEDPGTAPSCIESGGVDCVVTDYSMAGRDGLYFLRDVRAQDEGPPVVFFTGRGARRSRARPPRSGPRTTSRRAPGPDSSSYSATASSRWSRAGGPSLGLRR